RVADAAGLILLANEKADPYAIAFHIRAGMAKADGSIADDDCPETIWDELAEGEERQLITEGELDGRRCPACWHRWELVLDIIETCGDADYYDLANQAFEDLSYADRFHPGLEEFGAIRWEYALAVEAEIKRLQRQRDQQREAEATRNQ